MRKGITICLVFTFIFIIQIHAQNFRTGIVTGILATQVDGDQMAGYNKAGLVFGGLSNFKWSDKWSTQFEILYMQKGSRTQVDTTGLIPFYRLRLQYIEVPLMMNYHFNVKKTQWLVEAGLSYGTLIRATEQTDYGATVKPISDFYNKYDVGINLGISYGLWSQIFFHARYSYSILPIRTAIAGPNQYVFGNGQFNNVLSFSIRYYLKEF